LCVHFGTDFKTANMHDRAVYPADCNIVLSTVIIVYDGYEGFFEYS